MYLAGVAVRAGIVLVWWLQRTTVKHGLSVKQSKSPQTHSGGWVKQRWGFVQRVATGRRLLVQLKLELQLMGHWVSEMFRVLAQPVNEHETREKNTELFLTVQTWQVRLSRKMTKKTTGRLGSLQWRRLAMSGVYAADGEEKSMLSGCECRQRAPACSPCRPVWSRSHIRNVRRLTVNRILLPTCFNSCFVAPKITAKTLVYCVGCIDSTILLHVLGHTAEKAI